MLAFDWHFKVLLSVRVEDGELYRLHPLTGDDSASYCTTILTIPSEEQHNTSFVSFLTFAHRCTRAKCKASLVWFIRGSGTALSFIGGRIAVTCELCKHVEKVKLRLTHIWSALVHDYFSLISSDIKHVSTVTLDCKHFPKFSNGLHMVGNVCCLKGHFKHKD